MMTVRNPRNAGLIYGGKNDRIYGSRQGDPVFVSLEACDPK